MAPDQIEQLPVDDAITLTCQTYIGRAGEAHGGKWTCFRQPRNPNVIEVLWFAPGGKTVVDFVNIDEITSPEVGWGLLAEAINRILRRYRDGTRSS